MKRVMRISNQRGTALWEFALVFTAMFMMVFGIMDFSRAMYTYHFVSNAAREATRYASVRGAACNSSNVTPCPITASEVTTYVYSIVPTGMQLSSTAGSATTCPATTPTTPYTLSVCATWPGSAESGTLSGSCVTTGTPGGVNSPGCPVQVKVQYVYGFNLPYLSGKVSSISISSTSEVVISQ
jgi:Flp pilus assembly protein TadG